MNDTHTHNNFVRLRKYQENRHQSDEWFTPPEIINALGEFDLDPACGPLCKNKTAKRRFQTGGLERKWNGRVWLNPPFSNTVPWINKMIEHNNGIMLVMGRTDAAWVHRALFKSNAVFFLTSRTSFKRPDRSTSRCPIGCVLIPFGDDNVEAVEKSGLKGILLRLKTNTDSFKSSTANRY